MFDAAHMTLGDYVRIATEACDAHLFYCCFTNLNAHERLRGLLPLEAKQEALRQLVEELVHVG